jgi:hypothetical protein
MVTFLKKLSHSKRLGVCTLAALLLSCFSFFILILEYGVLNFGDSDMPPYQPDTPFERTVDDLWIIITFSAGLLWVCVIIYAVAQLFRAIKRRVA